MAKTYYEILGVSEDADMETIRRAYRRLIGLHHPDVRASDPDSEKLVRRLNEARDVLVDPEKRKAYDRLLRKKRAAMARQQHARRNADKVVGGFSSSQDATGNRSHATYGDPSPAPHNDSTQTGARQNAADHNSLGKKASWQTNTDSNLPLQTYGPLASHRWQNPTRGRPAQKTAANRRAWTLALAGILWTVSGLCVTTVILWAAWGMDPLGILQTEFAPNSDSDVDLARRSQDSESRLQAGQAIALAERAKIQADAGRITEAEQDLQEAVRLHAEDNLLETARASLAASYLRQAEAALSQSNPEMILRACDAAERYLAPRADIDRLRGEAFRLAGQQKYSIGNASGALTDYEEARKRNRGLGLEAERALAHVRLGEEALANQDPVTAARELRMGLSLDESVRGAPQLAARLAEPAVSAFEEDATMVNRNNAVAAYQLIAQIAPNATATTNLKNRLLSVFERPLIEFERNPTDRNLTAAMDSLHAFKLLDITVADLTAYEKRVASAIKLPANDRVNGETNATPKATRAAAEPTRPRHVPEEAIFNDGKWYWFPNKKMQIRQAMTQAAKMRGSLIDIDTPMENDFVQSQLRGPTFLAARKNRRGAWVNSTGKPQRYFNWAAGQPESGPNENILVFHKNEGWHDYLDNETTVCYIAVQWMKRDSPSPTIRTTDLKNLPPITNVVGMQLKPIPPGKFVMGSAKGRSNEEPQHEVILTKPFYLGVHEVTQEQYERVMGRNPSIFEDPQNPVEQVSWEDAVRFCQKLSELPAEEAAGRVYRLPTEAEWEYACRAGTTTEFSFDDDERRLDAYGWFDENTASSPKPVGQKEPNAWGLYDMHGNVWEWCSDWYGKYATGAATDPVGPAEGSLRVCRGGSWRDEAVFCRSAYRLGYAPSGRENENAGFRVVLISSGIPK